MTSSRTGMELLVLDDHRARLAADLEVDQRRAVDQHLAQHARVDLEGDASPSAAAVDDAGHEALAAQAPGRAGAALGALLDVEGGSCAVSHAARRV